MDVTSGEEKKHLALVTRLRQATRPLRHVFRVKVLRQPIQRTVPLLPEDWEHTRRRWHVLVDLVNEHLPRPGVRIAEVGTGIGITTAHMLKYCPQIERIYTIDLIKPRPPHDRLGGVERAEFILDDSVESAKRFDDETFDLVFIDADHTEAAVRRDLAAWVPKVKPGGLISGHDYGSRRYPGVTVAVNDFFRGSPHPLRLEANKVWWTRK